MITVLGGTFAKLHSGHKLMIRAAFDTGNTVILGLTTDDYLKNNKTYSELTYSKRKKALENYMSRLGGKFEILPLGTKTGNTETEPEYEAIVVSKETRYRAETINAKRTQAGLKPLRIIEVPIVLAEDLFPISSTRIIEGEIRPGGSRILPVRVGISTENDLKRNSLSRFLGVIMKNFTVEINPDYSLDSDQPFGEDTHAFALKRAMEALKDRDYGVGIESGLWREPVSARYLETHVCVVIDRFSRVTKGTSSGFELPEQIVELMKRGYNESKAFEIMHGIADVGKIGGVVNEISSGLVKRKDLIYESVRNAFIPRIGARYFGLDSKH